MSDDAYRTHKLTEAVTDARPDAGAPILNDMPGETHATTAEQTREEQESQRARNAEGDIRDRLVGIGKANHMAGRGNGRVSDQ